MVHIVVVEGAQFRRRGNLAEQGSDSSAFETVMPCPAVSLQISVHDAHAPNERSGAQQKYRRHSSLVAAVLLKWREGRTAIQVQEAYDDYF